MNCIDCPNAGKFHDEMKNLSKKLSEAIKMFNKGQFLQAIEDMELVVIRLEQIHHERLDRKIK